MPYEDTSVALFLSFSHGDRTSASQWNSFLLPLQLDKSFVLLELFCSSSLFVYLELVGSTTILFRVLQLGNIAVSLCRLNMFSKFKKKYGKEEKHVFLSFQ